MTCFFVYTIEKISIKWYTIYMGKDNKKQKYEMYLLKSNTKKDYEDSIKLIRSLDIDTLEDHFTFYNRVEKQKINVIAMVNTQENELAGTITFRESPEKIYVLFVETERESPSLKNYENKGIATRMLDELKEYAKKKNIDVINLLSVSERSSGLYWKSGFMCNQSPYEDISKAHLDMINYLNKSDVAVAGVLYHAYQKAKIHNTPLKYEINNLINKDAFDKIQQYVKKYDAKNLTELQYQEIFSKPDVEKLISSDMTELMQYSLIKEGKNPAHDFVKYMEFLNKSVNSFGQIDLFTKEMQKYLTERKTLSMLTLRNKILSKCDEDDVAKSANIIDIMDSINSEELRFKDDKLSEKFLRYNKNFVLDLSHSDLIEFRHKSHAEHETYRQMEKIFKKCFPQYDSSLIDLLNPKSKIYALQNDRFDVEGFIVLSPHIKTGTRKLSIDFLCVNKPDRNKGVGTFLLKKAEEYAQNLLCDTIEANALKDSMGVYYKNNYLTAFDEVTPVMNDIKKHVKKSVRENGIVCYEILKTMKQYGLKNVNKYITTIVNEQEYDNLYQYDLTQDQINECLVHNSQMPRLSAVIQDMLSYNIKPDQIHEYVDDLKSGDKYPNSKYKKYLLSDLKERNLKKLEKDEMVFEVMEDMYVDDMLHGHNVFKDEKNNESGNIKQG